MATEIDGIPIIFGDKRQPKSLPLSHPKARWGGFKTESKILPMGHIRRPGCRPLPCDIRFDRDQPLKLRDGTTIYVDVFRPVDEAIQYPSLLAWSPYGKEPGHGNQVLDDFPFRMGVPLHKLSELQKWEGPDPAYWVFHGYVVVNADPRGVYKSEGNIYQFGTQEGRDGADCVEWIGTQRWCSGKVALTGNSWLAISQWFIAAERPKYLAAIAPWEGLADQFRDASLGGVMSKPAMTFGLQLLQVNVGENSWENAIEMAAKYKIHNSYHEDKRANVERINVPAYVVASWSNPIHTYGTFCAYQRLKTQKWLRVHDTWEWPDYYDEANRTDLHKFFDYFLKGIENGWKSTSRFRAKILDTSQATGNTGSNFTATDFPPPHTKPLILFLDASCSALSPTYPPPCSKTYQACSEQLQLVYEFTQETRLCGPVEAYLQVSLQQGTDSDIYLALERIPKGHRCAVEQLKIPYERSYQTTLIRAARALNVASELGAIFYSGPTGSVRVSRRALNKEFSLPGFPAPDLACSNEVAEEQLVIIQPAITPIGMLFRVGDKLRLTISGINPVKFPPVDQATLEVEEVEDINKNVRVSLYCGERNGAGSRIILPIA